MKAHRSTSADQADHQARVSAVLGKLVRTALVVGLATGDNGLKRALLELIDRVTRHLAEVRAYEWHTLQGELDQVEQSCASIVAQALSSDATPAPIVVPVRRLRSVDRTLEAVRASARHNDRLLEELSSVVHSNGPRDTTWLEELKERFRAADAADRDLFLQFPRLVEAACLAEDDGAGNPP